MLIGPPGWARPTSVHRWTLTAEGSAAAAARAAVGAQGLAGRIITGDRVPARRRLHGTPQDRPRPATRNTEQSRARPCGQPRLAHRAAAGRRLVGHNRPESRRSRAQAIRPRRQHPGPARLLPAGQIPSREAEAGDSIEIIERIRASRARAAGLTVRASARFVEAARLAQLRRGNGFEYRPLTEWAGLPLPPKPADNTRPPIR